jgi:hypothetical protein
MQLGQPQFDARKTARAAVLSMDGAILRAQSGDIKGALQGLETLIEALEPRH